ncbi:MAG: Cys-Gln thioester bond-forming surface protein [Clostridia bacterium]|nr:Cys-Gln thioester bond-forming surface protein [Clostridia bacterium]
MKRAIAALMMLCLLAPSCAFAQTVQDGDLYVFNYTGETMPDYAWGQKYFHPSPHYNYLKVDEDGDGVREADWNYTGHKTMNLIHPQEIGNGGEGPYASTPVYCLDAVTDGIQGYAYRRLNLEESGYFGTETAGRLRAVLTNSFPHVTDMRRLEQQVNEWLRSADGEAYIPVESLTETECITAAQSVIWVLTNDMEIYRAYLGTTATRFKASDCIRPELLNQPKTEHTRTNCEALVRYLLALPAKAPADPLISQAAFISTATELSQHGSTWQAKVTARITANVHGKTALTLQASCGNAVSNTVKVDDGEHTYTLLVSSLTDPSAEILLTLEGIQQAADVFLFDPLGGRHQSQTMGGYIDCVSPVRVRMKAAASVFDPADPDDPQETVPRTGDSTRPVLLMMLLCLSALGIVMLRKTRKS